MGKKRHFINKKTSEHFHLVYRNQAEIAENQGEVSERVLISTKDFIEEKKKKNENFATNDKKTFSVNDLGMMEDGYDYHQHLREMGNGKFIGKSIEENYNEANDILRKRIELPNEVLPSVKENERLLEAITLTTETMDKDMQEALDDGNGFEELDDNFIEQMIEINELPEDELPNDGFDYDEHIAKMMERLNGKTSKAKNEIKKSLPIENPSMELLDEMFDQIALEYTDDEIGDLEDQIEDTVGRLPLDDEVLNDAVNEYITKQEDLLLEAGISSKISAKTNPKALKRILEEYGRKDDMEEEEGVSEPESELSELRFGEKEVLSIDRYLTEEKKIDRWDCETIVSTYTNTDNLPRVIGMEKTKKKTTQKKDAVVNDLRYQQIILSNKTGLPMLKEETEEEEEEEKMKKNEGEKRSKKETAEEKRLRKQLQKEAKRHRRVEKKQTSEAYLEEKKARERTENNTQQHVSVFRY